MRLHAGQRAPQFSTQDIYGRSVTLDDYAGRMVLLSFNRAAVCPLCNTRTWHLMHRTPIYERMGLSIVSFFESSPERAHHYLDRLRAPYPIIADLRHVIYDQYGLGASLLGSVWALLTRRAVYREAQRLGLGAGTNLFENLTRLDGVATRMPADVLVGPDGRVLLAYYGRDAGDFLLFRDLETAAFGAPLDERLVAQQALPRR